MQTLTPHDCGAKITPAGGRLEVCQTVTRHRRSPSTSADLIDDEDRPHPLPSSRCRPAAGGFVTATPTPPGSVTGRVTDVDWAPLSGVAVSATSAQLPESRATTTGQNGDYKLPYLPAGDYEIVYELEGYRPRTRAVPISGGLTVEVDVTLESAEPTEEIVVT